MLNIFNKEMMLKKKLIAFGDSVMKGVYMEDVDREGKPHYVIAKNSFIDEFGRRLGCDVSNYGRFGSTVTAGQGVIDRHSKDVSNSNYVLLEYGGNDSDFDWESIAAAPGENHNPRTPMMLFAKAYRGIIDRIRDYGSNPIILSLPPLCSKRYFDHFTKNMDLQRKNNVLNWLGGSFETINSWHESYNLKLFELGSSLGIPVVDITSAFLACRDYSRYLCCDGIHPNEDGQRLIADTVCDYFCEHVGMFGLTTVS